MRYFDNMKKEIVSSKNLIYVLHCADSDRVYVGQTSKGVQRPRAHFLKNVLESTAREARSKWIVAMRARGSEPTITILEECLSADDLDEAERFHIAYLRSLGLKMLNHTDGGGGMRGYQYTEERMRVHVEAMKKRAAEDPNYSEKMSAVSLAQWNEETRKAKSIAMLGNTRSATPKARKASSVANKGKPKSPEAKAKMSEAKRLKWQDPVYRARQVAAQQAFHQKPEARAQAAEWAKLASHDTHRSPEYRQRQSDLLKAIETPARREQRSETTTRLWEDDSYREKAMGAITGAQRQRREREQKDAALKEFARHQEAWSAVLEYTKRGPQNCESAT